MKRLLPAIVAFVLTIAGLLPSVSSLPEHDDEAQYGWSATYYGGLLARGDFRSDIRDPARDPGWGPGSPWALTQPMGVRLIYAAVLGGFGAPGPEFASTTPMYSLILLRLAAAACAGLGLSLISYRLRWRAIIAIGLFLSIPHVRDDLSRAWAEGPLLLGFGLAFMAYGSRWFAPVCGFAATFKLTALGLWPLACWHGFGNSRYAHILAFISAALTWTLLTPPSWFAGGPSYVIPMLFNRSWEYVNQSSRVGGNFFGLFFPTRYLWPVELATLLAVCILAPRLWRRLTRQAATQSPARIT